MPFTPTLPVKLSCSSLPLIGFLATSLSTSAQNFSFENGDFSANDTYFGSSADATPVYDQDVESWDRDGSHWVDNSSLASDGDRFLALGQYGCAYQTFSSGVLTPGSTYRICVDAAAADEENKGGLASLVYEYSWYNTSSGDETTVTALADLYAGDFTIDGVQSSAGSQISPSDLLSSVDWKTYCVDLLMPTDSPGAGYDLKLYISNGGTSPTPTADLLIDNVQLNAIPEPSASALLGLSALVLLRRKRP